MANVVDSGAHPVDIRTMFILGDGGATTFKGRMLDANGRVLPVKADGTTLFTVTFDGTNGSSFLAAFAAANYVFVPKMVAMTIAVTGADAIYNCSVPIDSSVSPPADAKPDKTYGDRIIAIGQQNTVGRV